MSPNIGLYIIISEWYMNDMNDVGVSPKELEKCNVAVVNSFFVSLSLYLCVYVGVVCVPARVFGLSFFRNWRMDWADNSEVEFQYLSKTKTVSNYGWECEPTNAGCVLTFMLRRSIWKVVQFTPKRG